MPPVHVNLQDGALRLSDDDEDWSNLDERRTKLLAHKKKTGHRHTPIFDEVPGKDGKCS